MQIKNVAIIDDDPIFVMIAKRIFEVNQLCDEFHLFKNGQLALDFILEKVNQQQTLPELFLLDINMPVMDGWEFLDALEQIENLPPIKLFMVTSSIDPKDQERARQYKLVKDFVVKPITLEAIQKLID